VLLVALGASCAFEVQSVSPGNGGLEGDDAFLGVADGGVEIEVSVPITVLDTTKPDTSLSALDPNNGLAALRPDNSNTALIKEPDCTPATEETSCPGTSCHPETLTCTALGVASRDTCETCFSDSNCAAPDHRCVRMTYYGEPIPDELTGFCLQIAQSRTVAASYDCAPPFAVRLPNRESLSGAKAQDYCGLYEKLTSCPAVLAFQGEMPCPNGRDDECPEGGLCREFKVEGNKTEYRCTYACDSDADCSSDSSKVACAGFCGG
jgi:hypothetical protein